MLIDARCFFLPEKTKGHNVDVTQKFTCNFTSSKVNFEILIFEVSNAFTAEANRLPTDGDKWLKKSMSSQFEPVSFSRT